MVQRTFFSSLAPKYWATMIPIPMARPELNEKNKKFTEPQLPTAASACPVVSTKFPTTMESTQLYNC